MRKERLSLIQLLDPKYHFNLTLYLDEGTITFHNLTVLQLSSLIYPYLARFNILNAQLDGDRAVLILSKGQKRIYLEIEII